MSLYSWFLHFSRIPLIPRNATTGDMSPTRSDRKRATPKKDKTSEERLLVDSPVPPPGDIEEKVQLINDDSSVSDNFEEIHFSRICSSGDSRLIPGAREGHSACSVIACYLRNPERTKYQKFHAECSVYLIPMMMGVGYLETLGQQNIRYLRRGKP